MLWSGYRAEISWRLKPGKRLSGYFWCCKNGNGIQKLTAIRVLFHTALLLAAMLFLTSFVVDSGIILIR